MTPVPPARHLLRARDLADRHYAEPIGVGELAAAAGLSRAHFSREFSRTFGESPKAWRNPPGLVVLNREPVSRGHPQNLARVALGMRVPQLAAPRLHDLAW
jgi:AraC-like DNA-binding protein